jgi:nucleoside-diphosphate-sugar epimerase
MASETTLSKGDLILITGVNGFVAAHLARQLLTRGYRVRGTVRNATKSKWLVDDLFRSEASNGFFELVTVEDMVSEGAFREAVRGVDAVAHVATINTLDPNPNNVIPQTVAGVVNLLKVAAEEPSVKSFVFTSSVVAAAMTLPEIPFHVDETSWNDIAAPMAWAPPPYNADRAMITYMASKVESEKALWKFVEERKPHFRTNAVLPYIVFGGLLHSQQNTSSDGWLLSVYGNNTEVTNMLKAGE